MVKSIVKSKLSKYPKYSSKTLVPSVAKVQFLLDLSRSYLRLCPVLCLLLCLVLSLISGVVNFSHKAWAAPPPQAAVDALILMSGEEWLEARNKIAALRNPAFSKMYEWMLYREDYDQLPFDRVAAFIDKNPHWPNQIALKKTAERVMPADLPPQQVLAWFAKYPPVSGQGMIKLLYAASMTGSMTGSLAGQGTQRGGNVNKLIIDQWPVADISADDLVALWREVGGDIPLKTHRHRLDKLLFAQKYDAARALANLMGGGYMALVNARIALAQDKADANSLLNQVPSGLRADPGLLYERLSWRRRNDMDQGAIEILQSAPDMAQVTNPDKWWKERHIMIRRMIESHNYKLAYQLSAAHGNGDKADTAEAEWMAGWLALRFLNQPQSALKHFETMYGLVATSISKSRGAYWAGRATERLGQNDRARTWFQAAAQYPTSYYGQLSLQHLHAPAPRLSVAVASAGDIQKMRGNDLIQAAQLAHAAGLDKIHALLVGALIDTLSTPSEFMAAAQILDRGGDRVASFRVAKAASWKNIYLGPYTYPDLSRQMAQIGGDHALYHAIIRQESQFDAQALSPAGALGLMQLMPATAKETAGKLGVAHQTSWLTDRPSHNILLGSSYIDRLIERFDNAYPMAVAGYNAGPGRVRQWIDEFGDPRLTNDRGRAAPNSMAPDWVDWIELIPVSETRNYVQRVLENYYVYSKILEK